MIPGLGLGGSSRIYTAVALALGLALGLGPVLEPLVVKVHVVSPARAAVQLGVGMFFLEDGSE